MDTAARLVILLALLFSGISAWSFGQVSKSTQLRFESGYNGKKGVGGSPTEAVLAAVSPLNSSSNVVVNGCQYTKKIEYQVASCRNDGGPNAYACSLTLNSQYSANASTTAGSCSSNVPATTNTPNGVAYAVGIVSDMCPQGAAEVQGGRCECSLGMKPGADGKSCAAYQCGAPGSYTAQTTPDVEVGGVGPLCSGGCEYQPNTVKAGTDGKLWATWPFRSTGKTCGGNPLSADNPVKSGDDTKGEAPVKCGANQCPGSVNGASVCVPCKNTSSSGPSTAASGVQPSDTPSTDPSKVIKNQETKTECTGTVCTTTTYYKNADGQVIGESKKEESQKSFCDENPRSPMCKEGAFGGACGAFTCDGDGVQCAMALEVHKRNCQLFDTPSELSSIGESVMNGQAVPAGHPGGKPSVLSLDALFKPQAVTAGCLPDKVVPLMGKQLVLPWSRICDPLKWMGHIAFAFALVHGALLVMRKL